jgi:CRISPR/Cas system-associated protein Csx1
MDINSIQKYVADNIRIEGNFFYSEPSIKNSLGRRLFAFIFLFIGLGLAFSSIANDKAIAISFFALFVTFGAAALLLKSKDIKINSHTFEKHSYIGFSKYHVLSKISVKKIEVFSSVSIKFDQLLETHTESQYREVDFYLESSTQREHIGVAITLDSNQAIRACVELRDYLKQLTGLSINESSNFLDDY